MTYIVFDIGGTKTRVASSDDLQSFSEVKSFKTPQDFSKWSNEFSKAIRALSKDDEIYGMAGGVRGVLDEEHGRIVHDSVLTAWENKPLLKKLEEISKTTVFLENDSAVAGLGEAVFGAGENLDIVAYHTISTGVGGVKIENAEIDLSSVGFEPGHQILDIDRTILGPDTTPTLENLVSGTAVKQRYGIEPYEIPQSDVLWEDLAGYLGQGLRNTILYWSPDIIVLGGSMIIGDPKIKIESIRKYTVEALDGFVECPLITTASLGDEAGLYGGLVILNNNLTEE